MSLRSSLFAIVIALSACSGAPPIPTVDVEAEANRIEKDFQTFCLDSGGDPEQVAATLMGAGWVEPTRGDGLRGFEERLPGDRVGDGMVFLDRDSCELSRDAREPRAVAQLLSQRLAKRLGQTPQIPDGLTKPCADYSVEGVIYSACHQILEEPGEIASLAVRWRPDVSGELAADARQEESR